MYTDHGLKYMRQTMLYWELHQVFFLVSRQIKLLLLTNPLIYSFKFLISVNGQISFSNVDLIFFPVVVFLRLVGDLISWLFFSFGFFFVALRFFSLFFTLGLFCFLIYSFQHVLIVCPPKTGQIVNDNLSWDCSDGRG